MDPLTRQKDLLHAFLSEPTPTPEDLPEISRPHFDLAERIRTLSQLGITPIIGEIKPRSPTAGVLRQKIIPHKIVEEMERAQAAGISVLTEPNFFGGSKALFSEVAKVASSPLLMKDFLTKEADIDLGAKLGADAVLLIVRLLGRRLRPMYDRAVELGLTPLVEVHSRSEMKKTHALEPDLVAINNRNLNDLSVDLETTRNMSTLAPEGSLIVSASGVNSRRDVESLQNHCDAFLVGSALMTHNVFEKLLELQGRRI